jgi:hypothetical protein
MLSAAGGENLRPPASCGPAQKSLEASKPPLCELAVLLLQFDTNITTAGKHGGN